MSINPVIPVKFKNGYEGHLNLAAATKYVIEQLKPKDGELTLEGSDDQLKQEDFEKKAIPVLNGLSLEVLRQRGIVTNLNGSEVDEKFSLEELGESIIQAIENGHNIELTDVLAEAKLIEGRKTKTDDAPPPISDNSGAATQRAVAEQAAAAQRAAAERAAAEQAAQRALAEQAAADEPGAADETGDREDERVDEGALGDQGGGGEGPRGPGFWARFGSWILGGLGILSAIGAFFAHAEGKARAFFAILGGLLLGGAVVNKWHAFGKAIFGGTDGAAKPQPDTANPALEPDAEPQPAT